jgi:hypothetical protein
MQLNQSTYETIFLLYIDNELSSKERLEVEAFIADNPSYALEMEALKATVLSAENIPYAFKENLKQQEVETSLEDLEKDWNQNYATILKDDMEAIPGLSTSFKNTLKKDATKEGIVLKPFGFSQQKFTYAAIAACLMVFLGYQQLTKTSVADSIASNTKTETSPSAASPLIENEISNASPKVSEAKIETLAEIKQQALIKPRAFTKLQVISSSKIQPSNIIEQESIVMAEPTRNNSIINNQAITTKLPSSYNNPMTIDAMPLPVNSTNVDAETTTDEKEFTSYEVIDTEDADRTIFIANFEIDGNRFRGFKRKVTSLFKNNKSERNQ